MKVYTPCSLRILTFRAYIYSWVPFFLWYMNFGVNFHFKIPSCFEIWYILSPSVHSLTSPLPGETRVIPPRAPTQLSGEVHGPSHRPKVSAGAAGAAAGLSAALPCCSSNQRRVSHACTSHTWSLYGSQFARGDRDSWKTYQIHRVTNLGVRRLGDKASC